MPRRTSPADAEHIDTADDLQIIVQDKREAWRADGAKARRRQRHYQKLLTQQLMKRGGQATVDADDYDASFRDED